MLFERKLNLQSDAEFLITLFTGLKVKIRQVVYLFAYQWYHSTYKFPRAIRTERLNLKSKVRAMYINEEVDGSS